jgi:hypothetical protein
MGRESQAFVDELIFLERLAQKVTSGSVLKSFCRRCWSGSGRDVALASRAFSFSVTEW